MFDKQCSSLLSLLFSHSVFHCPGSLAFKAFIGDCCDRDTANTHWNVNVPIGTQTADENKMFDFNLRVIEVLMHHVLSILKIGIFFFFHKNLLTKADCTLMVDPEDRPDEEILNGVALRPRVNSEIDKATY